MREVPLEGGRLDAAALRAMIAADRASGALPALLVGSAAPSTPARSTGSARSPMSRPRRTSGSTSTAPTARSACSTQRSRPATAAWNTPTLWFSTPTSGSAFPSTPAARWCGAATTCATRSASSRPTYARTPTRRSARSPNTGSEQTRPFRALKTWATIAARGRAGIAAQVARANALARELAALVEREPELELAAAPETSIVAFRARPAGCPPAGLDELNRALPEAVQARGRAFVTGTVFGGRETLRACILHPDTTSEHLSTLVAEVVATARTTSTLRASTPSPNCVANRTLATVALR